MVSRTVRIMGSQDVMAQFGSPETFYRGRWQNVKVTEIGPDEDTPLEVRRSLVGLVVPTIFTKESIEEQTGVEFPIPAGSRLAYTPDVVEALNRAGKVNEAVQLSTISPLPLDMYALEGGIYVPVD